MNFRTIKNPRIKSLDPIISNYFEKNKISIILYKRNIAIGTNELDITDTIIDELNQKLPSIKLN